MAYKKVGFNALYASLQDCLPTASDSIELCATVTSVKNGCWGDPVAAAEGEPAVETPERKTFESATLKDLSEIFEELSVCDVFTGGLDKVGVSYLPSYER